MNITQKISIIVPVYNVEKYVSKCIQSIISQTYKNLEIIIINDGSTDGSGDICGYYAKQDNRITLIYQENQGLSMARNRGIEAANGDYIGFIDSDDWIGPDMFSVLHKNAVIYDADISVCNYKHIDESEEQEEGFISKGNYKNDIVILENIEKIRDNMEYGNNSVWNKLYKRYLFDNIRFPEGKIFEDVFTTYKLMDKADRVVICTESLYFYLTRGSGITLSPFSLKHMDIVYANIEIYKYVTEMYPENFELERLGRRNIFNSLTGSMHKAYMDGRIEIYKEALQEIINNVKLYDYKNSGLSPEEENILKLLFKDMKSYCLGMRIYNKRNKK